MKIYINFVKHGFRRQLYRVTNWSNICSRLRSRSHHHRERCFVFFQTIALSSRVIEVHSATIRRILGKQRACLPREENSNSMRKYVISAGFRSGARSIFIARDCVHVDFPRNVLLHFVFSRARVSAAAPGFFSTGPENIFAWRMRGLADI